MAKEYIEREALLAEYDRQHTGEPGRARKLIEDAPAADVVEVVHGRWLDGKCTNCTWEPPDSVNYTGYEDEAWILTNYCPNCGARMDGE